MRGPITLGLAAVLSTLLVQKISACTMLLSMEEPACAPPSAERVLADGNAIVRGRVVELWQDPPPPGIMCRGPDYTEYSPQEVTQLVVESILDSGPAKPVQMEDFWCREVVPTFFYRLETLDAVNLPDGTEIIAVQPPPVSNCDFSRYPLFTNNIVVLMREPGEEMIDIRGCARVSRPQEGWDAFFDSHRK